MLKRCLIDQVKLILKNWLGFLKIKVMQAEEVKKHNPFADDLAMVEGMESVETLQFKLNREFNEADGLIRSLKLRINMTKTKVVLFRDPAQKLSHSDRNM